MPTIRKPLEPLTPDQQVHLMGRVEAQQKALEVLVQMLAREDQKILREAFHAALTDQSAVDKIPWTYQSHYQRAHDTVFGRSVRSLSDAPENDNEG